MIYYSISKPHPTKSKIFKNLSPFVTQGDQEGLFELAMQLKTFFIRLFATLQLCTYVLLVYLTDI
jgi:hypothetical protein